MAFGKLGQQIRGFLSTLAQNFRGEALIGQTYSTETTLGAGNFLSFSQPNGTVDGVEIVTGVIDSFEAQGPSDTLVTCSLPHKFDNVYLGSLSIVISGGTPYDGVHTVNTQPVYDQVPNGIQFVIAVPWAGAASGTYVVQNMVRVLATGSNRPRRTSSTEVRVTIAGTTSYNGSRLIYNSEIDSFWIGTGFVASETGTWSADNETQITTDGAHTIVENGVAGLSGGPWSSEVFRARNVKSASFEIPEVYPGGTSAGIWCKGADMLVDGPGGSELLRIDEGQYCFFDVDILAFGATSTANSAGYKGNIIYRRGWNHGVITPWGSTLSPYKYLGAPPGWSPKIDMSGIHSEKLAIMVASPSNTTRWIARISGVSGIGYVGS